MCFSPVGDLAAGAVVLVIGVDACRHLEGRRENLAIAALPLLLGAHQVDEALVWWGLRGDVPARVGDVAMWVYLIVALVVLPTLVPAALALLEPTRRLRWRYAPFTALGVLVSADMLVTMLTRHPSVRLGAYHLAYSVGLRDGVLVVGLYIVATCGPLLVSGRRVLVGVGVANLVAVVALAILCASGFTSLWCLYAALVSGAVALRLRWPAPDLATASARSGG